MHKLSDFISEVESGFAVSFTAEVISAAKVYGIYRAEVSIPDDKADTLNELVAHVCPSYGHYNLVRAEKVDNGRYRLEVTDKEHEEEDTEK